VNERIYVELEAKVITKIEAATFQILYFAQELKAKT
jgi:hypothetical protein